MHRFDYCVAEDLGDALDKLREHGAKARLLAGGTDLVLALKKNEMAPAHIICLQKVKALDSISMDGREVRIGALTTFDRIAKDATIQENFPLLSQAASLIGSWQVRNVATIGGNLCSASPSADSAPPLLALDAKVVIANKAGESEVPLVSFFRGPGKTVLGADQLLKEIIIKVPSGRAYGCYLKHMRRRAVDLALVGTAFWAVLDDRETHLEHVAIGLGGVAPTPIRAPEAEAVLRGLSYQEALERLPEAAEKALEIVRPISDIRASAGYRRSIVKATVKRAVRETLTALFHLEGTPK